MNLEEILRGILSGQIALAQTTRDLAAAEGDAEVTRARTASVVAAERLKTEENRITRDRIRLQARIDNSRNSQQNELESIRKQGEIDATYRRNMHRGEIEDLMNINEVRHKTAVDFLSTIEEGTRRDKALTDARIEADRNRARAQAETLANSTTGVVTAAGSIVGMITGLGGAIAPLLGPIAGTLAKGAGGGGSIREHPDHI